MPRAEASYFQDSRKEREIARRPKSLPEDSTMLSFGNMAADGIEDPTGRIAMAQSRAMTTLSDGKTDAGRPTAASGIGFAFVSSRRPCACSMVALARRDGVTSNCQPGPGEPNR